MPYHFVFQPFEIFANWTDSLLLCFPPRLLHAVHSVEMIITWLIVFQVSATKIWRFNFFPVFLLKYSLFLLNNFFLPTHITFSMETYSDFLLLLLVLFWSQTTLVTRQIITYLKPESVDSNFKLIIRVIFYFLLSVFRTWSFFGAIDRYRTDMVSLWISCIILLEFTSFMTFYKTRNWSKFSASLYPSLIVATLVATAPDLRAVAPVFFFYRHVFQVIRGTRVVPKSIPSEGQARQPHQPRPKKTSKSSH
jgi:hypothetical protein